MALALLALLGAECALPSLHFAMVEHAVCAEHGELEHAERPAGSHHDTAERAGALAVLAPAGAAEHAHDSCSVGTLSAPGAVVDRDGGAVPLDSAVTRAPAVVSEATAKTSVAVLSYAPKLAPPA